MKPVRHELKYTRKTETAWCTCRRWQKKHPLIPWTDAPSPAGIAQTEQLIDEFKKHIEEAQAKEKQDG